MAIKLTSRHISNLFCEKNNGAIFIICVWFSLYHNKIIFSNQVSDSLTLTFPSVYLASIYIMCPEILWAFNQILLSLNKNDWNLNRLQRIPARITSSLNPSSVTTGYSHRFPLSSPVQRACGLKPMVCDDALNRTWK